MSSPDQIFSVLRDSYSRLVVTIDVEGVREIEVEDADLDVLWDYLDDCLDESGNRINGHSGCDHCGIFGWPYGVPDASNKRKSVYRKLAKRAEITGEVGAD